jgi:hypothetical protein
MAIVLLIGVWLAALRSRSVLGASVVLTLIIVVLSIAAVGRFGLVGAVLARLGAVEDDRPNH